MQASFLLCSLFLLLFRQDRNPWPIQRSGKTAAGRSNRGSSPGLRRKRWKRQDFRSFRSFRSFGANTFRPESASVSLMCDLWSCCRPGLSRVPGSVFRVPRWTGIRSPGSACAEFQRLSRGRRFASWTGTGNRLCGMVSSGAWVWAGTAGTRPTGVATIGAGESAHSGKFPVKKTPHEFLPAQFRSKPVKPNQIWSNRVKPSQIQSNPIKANPTESGPVNAI